MNGWEGKGQAERAAVLLPRSPRTVLELSSAFKCMLILRERLLLFVLLQSRNDDEIRAVAIAYRATCISRRGLTVLQLDDQYTLHVLLILDIPGKARRVVFPLQCMLYIRGGYFSNFCRSRPLHPWTVHYLFHVI